MSYIDAFDPKYPKFNITEYSHDILVPEHVDNTVYLTHITCYKKSERLNDKMIIHFNSQKDFDIAFNYVNDQLKLTNAQKVRTFAQEASNEELPNTPQILSIKDIRFVCEMVLSELAELLQTVFEDEKDINEMLHNCIGRDFHPRPCNSEDTVGAQADALVDAIYYIYHTAAKKGINLDKVFNLVHKANMEKKFPDGTFHKRSDNKIIKPDDWTPPDIATLMKNEAGSF